MADRRGRVVRRAGARRGVRPRPRHARWPTCWRRSLAGGRVTVCTQCAARRGITEDDLLEGVRIAGAAVFAEEVLGDGVQALVY